MDERFIAHTDRGGLSLKKWSSLLLTVTFLEHLHPNFPDSDCSEFNMTMIC